MKPNPLTFVIAIYALIVTIMIILLLHYRNKDVHRSFGFSFGEFIIRIFYHMADVMQSFATGADSFLLSYRETMREQEKLEPRAECHRRNMTKELHVSS